MPRRRLFVFGIVSIVAGITVVRAEPANRKFFVARGAGIECTDDPGGTEGTPCRRVNQSEIAAVEESRKSLENGEPRDEEKSNKDESDGTDEWQSTDNRTEIDEARGGGKKRRGLLKVVLGMAAAAKGALLYAMIHAVALLAGKALVVAKIALALAAAVALKKALEHHDKTSYEIVKHPHHSYSQTHSASVDYDHHHDHHHDEHHGGSIGGWEGGHRRRRRR